MQNKRQKEEIEILQQKIDHFMKERKALVSEKEKLKHRLIVLIQRKGFITTGLKTCSNCNQEY